MKVLGLGCLGIRVRPVARVEPQTRSFLRSRLAPSVRAFLMPLCNHAFYQRGGRCKVLEEDETVQCSAERLAGWQGKKEQERSKRYQQIHLQQSKLQKAKTQVDQFLQNHDIRSDSRDVNVARRSCWGLCRTFPLHLAAKERLGRPLGYFIFFPYWASEDPIY